MANKNALGGGFAAVAAGLMLLLQIEASILGVMAAAAGLALFVGGSFWLRHYWRNVT